MNSQEDMNFDIIGTFGKSTKTPLRSKLHTWTWKTQLNWWDQKGCLEDIPSFLKKSKNTYLGSKLKNLYIGKVDLFCKIAKSQKWPKLQLLSNGPNFFCFYWVCKMVHDPWLFPLAFILFLSFILIFNSFKSNKINNKWKK